MAKVVALQPNFWLITLDIQTLLRMVQAMNLARLNQVYPHYLATA